MARKVLDEDEEKKKRDIDDDNLSENKVKKVKKEDITLDETFNTETKDDSLNDVFNNKNSENIAGNYNNVGRSTNKITYIFLAILLVFLALTIFIAWQIGSGKLKIVDSGSESQEKIELKHTNSTTVKSEGVYITDVSDVVDEVMPSIVAITSKTVISSGRFGPSFYGNGKYTTEGAGSGVIVAENDDNIFVLTNYHVVENSNELSVKFIDDKSYDASVKGVSKRKDIAIVAVSKKKLDANTKKSIKIATLGDSSTLKVGNGIIAIGNALGYGQSVTTGVVSALNREVSTDESTQDMIQIDAAINGGNSGGALLNSKGDVVGINTAKYSSNSSNSSASVEGMGFAIPISDVESVIEKLIKGENDEGGLTLGVEGYITDSDSGYNLPEGFYIAALVPDGNADKAGLEIGNIITEIDGNKITSINTIRKVLNKKEKGDKVKLKIKYPSRTSYKEKEVTITLKK